MIICHHYRDYKFSPIGVGQFYSFIFLFNHRQAFLFLNFFFELCVNELNHTWRLVIILNGGKKPCNAALLMQPDSQQVWITVQTNNSQKLHRY